MKNTALYLIFSLSLVACSGGGANTLGGAPSDYSHLPNESALVEVVEGNSPADFYIANQQALGALDADGNGLWDDVEQRLSSSSAAKAADPRAVRLMVRSQQARLLYKTRAEAQASPGLHAYARSCTKAAAESSGMTERMANQLYDDLTRDVEAAVFVTKERVLASQYASALASGGSFLALLPDLRSCDK